ncbi:hypothetical protein J2741_000776 [Methanolinea mesophila]|uniref:hypothetical protein n=1 Tax=Methanolinea mesophila TaxID=547055 RepID=UPI001AE4522E|nr:hypothetical protein [Methanolinea mesophila]MBP1928229.1 hypothetical protein [Methanolinea mesophila]
MRYFRIIFLIFLFTLMISILFGYPRFYLNDEWISANQLNHLVIGADLLHGYYPYGQTPYAMGHGNVLSYTLAFSIVSAPVYILFSLFGDSFRLFVNVLWLALVVLFIILIETSFSQYARYKGIPWTYGLLLSALVLFVLNMWLYQPFVWKEFPELAALVFTNHILFALSMPMVFLIFREVFENDWWGVFGFIAVLSGSSYLFWSSTAKDHILALLFFLIALFFLIRFVKKGSYLNLMSSYIAIGWTAWVRPELGFGLLILFIISGLVIAYRKGIKEELKTFLCGFASIFGALPLFINNYGLTGNPFTNPFTIGFQAGTENSIDVMGNLIISQYSLNFLNPITFFPGLYRIFFDPKTPIAAGIFQVSPFAFMAVILIIWLTVLFIKKRRYFGNSQDRTIVIIMFLVSLGVLFPYMRSIAFLGTDGGIIPDIRYLSPIYIPLAILGCSLLKKIGFEEKDLKKTLESFVWIGLVTLPLAFIVLQAFIGNSMVKQLQVQAWINYTFLIIVATAVILVILGKVKKEWLWYLIPVLFASGLIWYTIVGYRFTTTLLEHYHFWLPVTNWTRLIFLKIFPW